MNDTSIVALRHGSWLGEIEAVWQDTAFQGGGRYTPVFRIWRLWLTKVFWLEPIGYHAAHLFVCWLPVGLLGLWMSLQTGRLIAQPLTFACFLLFGDISWGSNFWNLYDVSTYDPLATAGFGVGLAAAVMACRAPCGKCLAGWWIASAAGFFWAAHSKEPMGITCLGLAGVAGVLAAIAPPWRRRLAALAVACGVPGALFLIFYWLSGGLGKSRVNEYSGQYDPSISTICANFGFVIRYSLELGGLLIPIVMGAAAWRMGARLAKTRLRVDVADDLVLLALVGALAAVLIPVLPVTILQELPRMLYAPSVLFSVLAAFVLLRLPTWMGEAVPKWKHSRAAARLLAAASLLLVVLMPLRLWSFTTFYLAMPGSEHQVAHTVCQYLVDHPNEKVSIITAERESALYWGIHNYCRNRGIESSTERLVSVIPDDLTGAGANAAPMFGVICSRDGDFVDGLLPNSRVGMGARATNRSLWAFSFTKSTDLRKWLTAEGEPPWGCRHYPTPYRLVVVRGTGS